VKTSMRITPLDSPMDLAAELPTVDEKGDAIFRFKLRASAEGPDMSLDEFYRAQIHDLLKVVRLYVGTTPVLVDGFAFRRELDRVQPLQPRAPYRDDR
jgi:hypothetical protein